jgi:precorrin-2 dehydrogenase/sirohydrochlorin ferrochelatase
VSAYPVMLDGGSIRAVVIGGGPVAARKVRGLVQSGAEVRVVARSVSPELAALATTSAMLSVEQRPYAAADLDGATLVFAATDDASVNAEIARDARARGVHSNIADAPERGTFVTPAVHRSGDIVVAVSAGGVPTAARRIRDALARVIDERYAAAVADLSALRRRLLASGDGDRWREAAAALTDVEFGERVESGRFGEQVAQWR